MRLLHIALGHLLHHKVPVNFNVLDQGAIYHAPLARDGEGADGGLSIDKGVDAVGHVCECEFVGCLHAGGISMVWNGRE